MRCSPGRRPGPARLGTEDRHASALRGSLAADIAELRTGLLEWNVNPLEGAPVEFLTIPAYQRLETPEDGEKMVARWREMARYSDGAAGDAAGQPRGRPGRERVAGPRTSR